MKAGHSDYIEIASECFLTKALPTDATEWEDATLSAFIEDNVSEAYQDWHWATIYEHIEDTASAFWYELKKLRER
jgi:type II secretory pathway component PulL